MKKVLSLLRHVAGIVLEELRHLRSAVRAHFPLFTKLIPDESAGEMEWDVEDPYEESMFMQIRAANAAKSASAAK